MTSLFSDNQLKTFRGQFLQNQPLSNYTSWKVGGLANYLYQPQDYEDLSVFLSCLSTSIEIFWLGLGTNVLVRDGGFHGVIILIQNTLENFKMNGLTVDAESGLPVAKLARHCAEQALSGLEFLAGIPGTVGGALFMNAGAYGHQTWDQVNNVTTINRQGKIQTRTPKDYQIGYRSVKTPEHEWFISARFQLSKGDKTILLKAIDKMLTKRQQSQPLDLPNAGSVFRNPDNDTAARLIESCGLKGYRIGGAQVSEKHANFIVNDQNATASDIEQLIQYIIEVVQKKHQIKLNPEVKIIGENK